MSFIYRPLSPSREARIRFLRLDPGLDFTYKDGVGTGAPDVSDTSSSVVTTSPVGARGWTILHGSLSSPPTSYFALSYSWGDPSLQKSIVVDGAPLRVSVNLETALDHLSQTVASSSTTPEAGASSNPNHDGNTGLVLWVDALCINQANPVEKAEQIQFMGQIYAGATRVISWLGPADQDSDDAMRWIEHFGSRASELQIGSRLELRLGVLLHKMDANGVEAIMDKRLRDFLLDVKSELEGQSETSRRNREALWRLFNRAYWYRVWVIQEVAYGKEVVFRCGGTTVSEDQLHHALRLIRNFGGYEEVRQRRYQQQQQQQQQQQLDRAPDVATTPNSRMTSVPVHLIATLHPINMLKIRRTKASFELAYLLRLFWGHEATDPRDKVFAMLGLAADAEGFGLRSNYLKTPEQVYTETAMALLAGGYLDMLAFCDATAPGALALPSWVPQFSQTRKVQPLQLRTLNRSQNPPKTSLQPNYCASRGLSGTCAFREGEIQGSMVMETTAIRLGDLLDVGAAFDIVKGKSVGTWLKDLRRLHLQIGANEATFGDLDMSPVWRTAVGDQWFLQGEQIPRLKESILTKVQETLEPMPLEGLDVMSLGSLGLRDYCRKMQVVGERRRPMATESYFGFGPRDSRIGDSVWVLAGAQVPYVLRGDGQGGMRLVGEAFLDGVMDGEAIQDRPRVRLRIS